MTDEKDTEKRTIAVEPPGRFFRLVDWLAFAVATAATLGVYVYTLAPTVTLEDSGELATGAAFMGVPHPPGYPIWSLTCWFFTKCFAWVGFRGQPNPAWSVALASAVFGALAAGLTAMLISRSGSEMLKHSRKIAGVLDSSTDDLICAIGGVVCSLVFAFSPVEWSQATIVEIYALNAFFLVLVFLLTYRWMCRPTDTLLYVIAFVFGLGLTNYQVLLLAGAPLAFAVLLRDIRLFRDVLIAVLPYGLVLALMGRYMDLPDEVLRTLNPGSLGDVWGMLLKYGVLPPIVHPLHFTGYFYFALNAIALALIYFLLPRGRAITISILCLEAGLAFYIYMPIVSDLRNPPMNWGYPRTWEGFKHAISRGQYEKIVPTDMFTTAFLHQIWDYMYDLRRQFTLPVELLGFLPFTTWRIRISGFRFNAFFAAVVLCIPAVILVMTEEIFFPNGIEWVTRVHELLRNGVLLLLVVGVIGIGITQFKEVVLPVVGTILDWIGAKDVGRSLKRLSPEFRAANPEQSDADEAEEQCEVTMDSNSQKWIFATLLGFLVMSIVLIWLANPKGDIQDAFIQKVKFISSHALFSFFIGYGLILGLAFVETWFRKVKVLSWAAMGVACLIPLIPIQQNYFNKELVRVYGGAEQNGHDFGWQFGNYQLRGADAILEELDPNEEPLPNPSYPREMKPDAIFFGGTDPGRFVPTYMIYCARVREDVYLITQNALADNTYMNVMRDLYGDQIWIPSVADSGRSFQRYVDEVQSGKRPRNAELKIEGGRVSVQGALGVMEINGILAEMIFERNKYRHAFYVEESYVIRWMYPYLTPHGLIMEINSNICQIPEQNVADDMDFWDWYTRRLAGSERFRRDVVARKSFSKLRSAIAGLYSNRGRWGEAEEAFQQARILYPLSPEANFRLAQEVFLQHRRFQDAIWLMEEFEHQDPGNDRIPSFTNQLRNLDRISRRIQELETMRSSGKPMDINAVFELAQNYLQMQQRNEFRSTMAQVLANANLPFELCLRTAALLHGGQCGPEMVRALDMAWAGMPTNRPVPPSVLQEMAKMYAAVGQMDKMAVVVKEYLRRSPSDWKAWLDLAAVQVTSGRPAEATKSLENAIRQGGREATALIVQDQRFANIRAAAERRLNSGKLPGILDF
jgi:thioredoxin-like negative regulator of GroEL